MQTKNRHHGEHHSHPAGKMIPKENLKDVTAGERKVMKKVHRKRSRRFLKDNMGS